MLVWAAEQEGMFALYNAAREGNTQLCTLHVNLKETVAIEAVHI